MPSGLTTVRTVADLRTHLAQWRKAGYQEQEGYENLKELLETPISDAQVCTHFRGLIYMTNELSLVPGFAGRPFPYSPIYRLRSRRQPSTGP